MKNRSNEQLCALAQKGNTNARDLLLENNFGFIRKTANEIYFGMNLAKANSVSTKTTWSRRAVSAYWTPSLALTAAKALSF